MREISGELTEGDDLIVQVDDNSIWYFDEIRSNATKIRSYDLSNMINSDTEIANDGIQFITSGTDAFDTEPTVLNSPKFKFGEEERLTGINIDSGYADRNGDLASLPDHADYLTNLTSEPFLLTISGDGNVIYYTELESSHSVVRLELDTGTTTSTNMGSDVDRIETNEEGDYAAVQVEDNEALYRYNADADTKTYVMHSVTGFEILDNGDIFFEEDANDVEIWLFNGSDDEFLKEDNVKSLVAIESSDLVYYKETNTEPYPDVDELKVLEFVSGYEWKEKTIFDLYDVGSYKVSDDGSLIFMNLKDEQYDYHWYMYKPEIDSLQKLSDEIQGESLIDIVDNKDFLYQKSPKEFVVFDPITEAETSILDMDIFVPSSGGPEIDFADKANKLVYSIESTANDFSGVRVKNITNPEAPERYLLSFDINNSWYGYINGEWIIASDDYYPAEEEFLSYGMSKDQVNSLDESDFSKLYDSGQEIYAINISMYLASVDRFTTPSIKDIEIVTVKSRNWMSGDNYNTDLYTAKKNDIDATGWRKIKKLYPIEISNRYAEYAYYIQEGTDYKVYKDGSWSTLSNAATNLADVEDNWIDIGLEAMSAEELRAIPEAALTSELAGNTFSVVYAFKTYDQSTEGYTCNINVDYVEDLFSGTTLTLSIYMYGDSAPVQYTSLTATEVEDFMEWVNARQYNYGPTFYRIDNGTVSDFINYFMIKKVTVSE